MADDELPLRRFRNAQSPKLSLKALADQVGLSESQLSRIEREGTTSLPQAMKLSEITSLPVEAFAPRGDAQEVAA